MDSYDVKMQIKGLEDFRNDYVRIAKDIDKEKGFGLSGVFVIDTINAMDKRIDQLYQRYKELLIQEDKDYERIKKFYYE